MDVNLVLIKKNGQNKVFPLSSDVTVIGRRHDCTLRIPLMTVSKKHCRLFSEDGQVKIVDLGSKNGTLLNGNPIDETILKAGDNIKIGPLKFVLQIDGSPASPGKSKPSAEKAPAKASPPAKPAVAAPSESDDIFDNLSDADLDSLELPADSDDLLDLTDPAEDK